MSLDKLLLLSAVGVSVVLPMVAAKAKDPRRAMWLCLMLFVSFNVLYSGLLFYVFPRLL